MSAWIAIVSLVDVTRWTRYGHDRLYVKADDGVDLGWWDIRASKAHPTLAGSEELLAHVAADWKANHRKATPSPRQSAPSPDTPKPRRPAGPDFIAPANSGIAQSSPVTSAEATAPQRPVRDILQTPPGANLYEKVAAARAAGEQPTLARRLRYGKNAYSSWERGLIGEQLVEAELRKLVTNDRRWGYLNSIPVGENGADIDHLIAGPAGVFTINAKYHRGANIWVGGNTMMVNGTRQHYIRNARYEAKRASRLLTRASGIPIDVTGVVVPVDARSFTVREQPEDVLVVNRAQLILCLRSLPQVLTWEQVYRALSAARLSSSWEA